MYLGKRNYHKNRFPNSTTFFIVVIISSLNFNPTISHAQKIDNESRQKITEGWEYRWGDSPFDDQNIPVCTYADSSKSAWKEIPHSDRIANLPDRNGHTMLWLKVRVPEGEWEEPHLFISEIYFAFEVYQSTKLIYQYRSVNVPGNGKFHGGPARFIPLQKNASGDTLFFRIYSEDHNLIGLSKVEIGSKAGFITYLLKEELSFLVLGFFFILSGIVPLINFVIKKEHKTYFAFGLLSVSIGGWTLSEFTLLELWLSSPFVWFGCVNVFIFLTAIGMCFYFENIFSTGYQSFLRRLRQALMFILFVVVPILFITEPSITYWLLVINIYFLLLAIALLTAFIISLKLALRGNREAQIITLGFAALCFFGIYDILGGAFKIIPWAGNTYHWGMLFFVLALDFITERRLRNYANELEKYNAQLSESRFETLKTQVNPHFLFNSLNTLSSLIYIDPDDASKFVRQLSKVYRFVLETRERELIALETELKILEAYIYLAQTRFKESLKIEIDIDGNNKQTEIVPLTLQMLIENAIKHNVTSRSKPLIINIFIEDDVYLVVQNNLQLKSSTEYSSRIGLKNIISRYSYLTNHSVLVEESKNQFTVKIPLLRKQNKIE